MTLAAQMGTWSRSFIVGSSSEGESNTTKKSYETKKTTCTRKQNKGL